MGCLGGCRCPQVQSSIADVVFNQFVDPYTFPSAHPRLLEPYNYYQFGQRYTGVCSCGRAATGRLQLVAGFFPPDCPPYAHALVQCAAPRELRSPVCRLSAPQRRAATLSPYLSSPLCRRARPPAGSLTDFDNSVLGQRERFAHIAAQLAAGENVVLLANHQTEADPGVFAHMLEDSFPELAQNVIYVAGAPRPRRGQRRAGLRFRRAFVFCAAWRPPPAVRPTRSPLPPLVTGPAAPCWPPWSRPPRLRPAGDRVVTDALCKPFSMGRNLFCVYSKKRMEMDEDEVGRRDHAACARLSGGAVHWRQEDWCTVRCRPGDSLSPACTPAAAAAASTPAGAQEEDGDEQEDAGGHAARLQRGRQAGACGVAAGVGGSGGMGWDGMG